MDEDRDHLDQYSVILQSLSQVITDSWIHLFDHYTRVERRNRRLNRDKAKQNSHPLPDPPHVHPIIFTNANASNQDLNNEMMPVDIENDDPTDDGPAFTMLEPQLTTEDEFSRGPPSSSAMDIDEPTETEVPEEDATVENSSGEDMGHEYSSLDKEVDQDITENVEVPAYELLKQQRGETDEDWVARLSCIIGDSFYENTLDADVLEQMVDDEQWVAEQEAEYFGSVAVEESDAPVRPVPMEIDEDPLSMPKRRGRGRKRKLAQADEVNPTDFEFGESTVPARGSP